MSIIMMPVNVFGMKIDLQKLLLMPRVNLEYICFQCSKGLRSEVGRYAIYPLRFIDENIQKCGAGETTH